MEMVSYRIVSCWLLVGGGDVASWQAGMIYLFIY